MISKLGNRVNNLSFSLWTVPFALLVLCTITYGLLMRQLGFYWDDWAQILVNRIYGSQSYWAYFASDRPFSAWTHILFMPLLGSKPLNWQIFTLLLRWMTAVGMWFTLINLWPIAKAQAFFAASLFSIYPVFTQQATSVAYHQHWLNFCLYFISIGLMVLSIKKPSHFWKFLLAALITEILQLSITEYFVGLEFLRPLLIWFILPGRQRDLKNSMKAILRTWLPYLSLLLIFIIWRIFFVQFPGGEDVNQPKLLYSILTQPLSTLPYLFNMAIVDILFILVSCWSRLLDIQAFQNVQRFDQIAWFIAFICAALFVFYSFKLFNKKEPDGQFNGINGSWSIQALLLGISGVVLGTLPAWIIDKQVILDIHSNRLAIPAMFGASLLWVVFIEWTSQHLLQKTVLLGLLMVLSVNLHLRTANDYRWLWTDQTRFYWQLYWRAPYIEPGTAIISEEEIFPDQGLFSTSSAINLLYPQDFHPEQLAYWVYGLRPRFTYVESISGDIPLKTSFRILSFKGRMGNSLMVYKNAEAGNCLWVLGPDDIDNPELSELLKKWIILSNQELIKPVATAKNLPPEEIFGKEPTHTWCYYYQKAALAQQMKDWDTIARLGDEASRKEYHPSNSASNRPQEWLPFINGYALSGNWQKAKEITLEAALLKEGLYQSRLCHLWNTFTNEEGIDEINDVKEKLGCP